MDFLWKNLAYSVRMLVKRPSVMFVAVIAIALGIGANTAIFSVVNRVLLQPLPYEEPQQLVNIATEQRDQALDGTGMFSVPDFLDLKQSADSLTASQDPRRRAGSSPALVHSGKIRTGLSLHRP